MCVCSPHISAGAVEQADARRWTGTAAPTIDLASRRRPRERRPQRAADQRQPQQQADEQEPLPEAADVGVFPALVAEPEVVVEAELLHHRQPLAGERADDDDEQADEQEVDAEALEFRLVPRDRRPDVQARASHAVAIHSTASCVCQVRVSE